MIACTKRGHGTDTSADPSADYLQTHTHYHTQSQAKTQMQQPEHTAFARTHIP